MSIELTEKIVGIWFVDLDNESDWLGAMERTDEGYQVTYRFRYYVDDKAHDSDDKKSEDWDDNSVAQLFVPTKVQSDEATGSLNHHGPKCSDRTLIN